MYFPSFIIKVVIIIVIKPQASGCKRECKILSLVADNLKLHF
jgi:hypothetical protein